jgi:hypothetical protein
MVKISYKYYSNPERKEIITHWYFGLSLSWNAILLKTLFHINVIK